MAYTALPATLPQFATGTGANVLTGLTATAAEWMENITEGTATYGIIRYTFSGSPDLSTVIAGHNLNVTTGFTNAENKVSGAKITAIDNGADWVKVKSFERLDDTLDETGVSATSTTITANAARIMEPSTAKKGIGWLSPEKPSDGIFNWLFYWLYQWIYMLQQNYPTGFLLQGRLTAGENVSISDNADNTYLISAQLTTATGVTVSVSQGAHGFATGDTIRHNGTSWVDAKADSIAGCTGTWVVYSVPTSGTFSAIKSGIVTITGHGLGSGGTILYLSADTAALLTSTRPEGNTTRVLGYFLKKAKVIDANTLEIFDCEPTFNPLYASWTATGTGTAAIQFACSLSNVGYRLRIEASARNDAVSAPAGYVSMSFAAELPAGDDYTYNNYATTDGTFTAIEDASHGSIPVATATSGSDNLDFAGGGILTKNSDNFWYFNGQSCTSSGLVELSSVTLDDAANITTVEFDVVDAEWVSGDKVALFIDRMPLA
jgi:hypothetical protein